MSHYIFVILFFLYFTVVTLLNFIFYSTLNLSRLIWEYIFCSLLLSVFHNFKQSQLITLFAFGALFTFHNQTGAKKRKVEDPKCIFCANFHKSVDCKKFPSLAARRNQLAALHRCTNCLRQGHEGASCRGPPASCNYCKLNHNSAFFFRT